MKHWPKGEQVLPPLTVSLFVLLFVAEPLVEIGILKPPLLGMTLLIVLLSGMFTLGTAARFARPVFMMGGIVLALQIATLFTVLSPLKIANDIAGALFILMLSTVLLRQAMGPGHITTNRVVGAVAVYLLVILFFALQFDLLESLVPGSFSLNARPLRAYPAGASFFYLSVITATSVGFGDITPVHPFARSMVMIEAVLGHIYVAVLLARLVSLEVADHFENASRTGPTGSGGLRSN